MNSSKIMTSNPSVLNNTSVCSCSNCNSLDCFAIRNKGYCPCNQLSNRQPFSGSNKNMPDKLCQNSIKKSKIPETESVLRERVKKETTYENNNINNVASIKKYSKHSYNCVPDFSDQDNTDDNKSKKSAERIAYSHSCTANTDSKQNVDTNTAKLSAQIMNVPYKDFKESISYNKSELSQPAPTKMTGYDILRRIKEAYDACSCKVCECLIANTINHQDFCKCRPCECNKCSNYALKKNIHYNGKFKNVPPSGCLCMRCDRKTECKSLINKLPPDFCDCDPRDYMKYDSLTKPCNCQPCECIDCRSYPTQPNRQNTLMVASMREDVPRAYCQCSPCECAECAQSYTMASSLRREMGTGINRPVNCSCDTCLNHSCESHGSNTCTCEIQKQLMRKPVEKDTRDYDIHRASVIKNVTERKSKNMFDAIAMLTAVGTCFPNHEINNYSCRCDECECIVCSCKDNGTDLLKRKPSQYRNLKACKCSHCECVICDSSTKMSLQDRKLVNKDDCSKCYIFSKPSIDDNNRSCNTNDDKHIIIRKMLLKTDEKRTQQINPDHNLSIDSEGTDVEGLKDNCLRKNTQIHFANTSEIKEFRIHRATSVCNAYSQDKKTNIVQSYHMIQEHDSSHSFISANSSLSLSSKISNIQQICKWNSIGNLKYPSQSICEKIDKPCNKIILNSMFINPVQIDVSTNLSSNTKHNLICNSMESIKAKIKTEHNTINPNTDDNQHKKYAYSGIAGADIKKNELPDINRLYLMKSVDAVSSDLRSDIEITKQHHKISNAKDLSLDLLRFLKNANGRLHILMKKDINLPKMINHRKEIITSSYCETNSLLQDSYSKHTEDLSDKEIDFDKITSVLQQAKYFSVELTKVLEDYKQANRKLESKYLKKTQTNMYSNAQLDMDCSFRSKDIEIKKSMHCTINVKRKVNGLNQASYSLTEPVQKYGFHNLNVAKNKQEKSFESDHLIEKIASSNINNKSNNGRIKDNNDINKYSSRHDLVRQVSSKLSHGNSVINKPVINKQLEYGLEEHLEPLRKTCSHIDEARHKCRSDKTQKNIKGGKILRVPRSVTLFKRQILKEALMNIAADKTNNAIRANELVPQSVQCDFGDRVIIADETTQHELLAQDERETTSMATDESSRYMQPVKEADGEENVSWSILKKTFVMPAPYLENKGLMPPLLMEVKDTLRAMARQYDAVERSEPTNEVTVTGHGNKALLQLQKEVNELWESSMPETSKSEPVSPTAANVKKSSCATLKVKCLGVRRVSDRTVLVKWKAPQDVTSIQGYELLVDGCLVQKMSSTRSMAVVTCLPHSEKVLITVRTLVSATLRRSHYPSATLVYRTNTK